MTTHKKETSLSPDCLDDIYENNDDLNLFTIVDDSVFILMCAVVTALLLAVIFKLTAG